MKLVRQFLDLPNDSKVKTYGVALLLCLVCSVAVSAAAVALKPVQDEIRQVYSENPAMLDNLPATLSLVHDIALGRLARKGFTVNAQVAPVQGQEPVPVEGRNKPSPSTFSVTTISFFSNPDISL